MLDVDFEPTWIPSSEVLFEYFRHHADSPAFSTIFWLAVELPLTYDVVMLFTAPD